MKLNSFYGIKNTNSDQSSATMDHNQSADSSFGFSGNFSGVLNESNIAADGADIPGRTGRVPKAQNQNSN